jgi:PqqD family protein of HPr-rel-A system
VKRWQAHNDQSKYIVDLDDHAIIYNPLSGDTHELNILAVDVLRFFNEALTEDQIYTQVANLYGVPLDKELTFQLQHLIQQFDNLGLIQPIIE